MGAHVFISYSHKDSPYVERLTAYLTHAGIEVWTDRGIAHGAEWVRTIDQQLRACAAFVPVMSRNSREAEWVAKEILLALQLSKPTFPLLLDGDRFLELLNIQDESVVGGRLPGDAYLHRLRAQLGWSPAVPVQAAAATHHPYPRQAAGQVIAWGSDDCGQASALDGLVDAVAIAGGAFHSVALLSDGSVAAWGDDELGQVSAMPDLPGVVSIAAGGLYSLALHANGTVSAWGDDGYGQVSSEPRRLANVMAIAAGHGHALALHRDGGITAWGNNDAGQVSQLPAGLVDAAAVAAGGTHSLALHRDGRVTAWGDDQFGQVTGARRLTDVVAIAAGGEHNLAVHRDGRVTAWGDNEYGQASVPATLLNGDVKAVAVAAGAAHSLALLDDGRIMVWGSNSRGQLDVRVPAWLVTGAPDQRIQALGIASGYEHCLAIVRT